MSDKLGRSDLILEGLRLNSLRNRRGNRGGVQIGDADTLDGYEASDFLDPQYVVLTADSNLMNERVLAVGSHLDLTDGGAGSNVALDVDVGAAFTWAGQHSFSQPVEFSPGTAAAPAITFDGDTHTGIYRYADNWVGISGGAQTNMLLGDGRVLVRDGSASTPALAYMNDSHTGIFWPENDHIAISTGGVERVRVDDQGYVGILTDTPTEHLDVNGNIKATRGVFGPTTIDPDAALKTSLYYDDAGGASQYSLRVGANIPNGTTAILAGGVRTLSIEAYNYENTNDLNGSIYGMKMLLGHVGDGDVTNYVGTTVGIQNTSTSGTIDYAYHYRVEDRDHSNIGTVYGLYIDDLTDATTNYAIYTNAGLVRFGDQVDIVGPLEVNDRLTVADQYTFTYPTPGTTHGNIHLMGDTQVNDDTMAITFGDLFSSGYGGNRAAAGIYVQSSGMYGTKMYFATTNSYGTGSQVGMMLDHYRKVGIGTILPSARLHVEDTSEQLRLGYDATNYSRFVVDATGNLGIYSPVNVNGNLGVIYSTFMLYGSVGNLGMEATGNHIYFTRDGANYITATDTAGYLTFRTGGYNSRMTIREDGNVGIGTLFPSAPLHVIKDGYEAIKIGDYLGIGESSGAMLLYAGTDRYIAFVDGFATGGHVMRVDMAVGSVGIGTGSAIPDARLHVISTSEQLRLGYASSNYAAFTVDSTGNLTIAPTGTDGRNPIHVDVLLDAATVATDHWVSGTTGWGITYAGVADFRQIAADELYVETFIYDVNLALAGSETISKSLASLSRDFTVPATTGTLYVYDLPGITGNVFADGDWILLCYIDHSSGLTVSNVWGTVVAVTAGDEGADEQAYTWTTQSGTTGWVIKASAWALDYGVSGQGIIHSTVLDPAGAPYMDVQTWTTDPSVPGNITTHVRLGHLDGISGIGDEYGLWAGEGTTDDDGQIIVSDSQLTIFNVDLNINDGATTVIKLDRDAPYLAIGDGAPSAWRVGTGFWFGKESVSGEYRMHMGDPTATHMYYSGGVMYVTGSPGNYSTWSSSGIGIYADSQTRVWISNTGNARFGLSTGSNVYITPTSVQIRDSSTVYADLTGSVLTLGLSTAEHSVIDASGFSIYDAATMYARFAATTTIGYIGGGEYVSISSAGISMYGGGTQHVSLSSAGTFWAGDSSATERIQWDTTYGLRIYNASNAAVIRFPTSGEAQIVGTLEVTSPGEITAGNGAVELNSSGIEIIVTTTWTDETSLKFTDGSSTHARMSVYESATDVYGVINAYGASGQDTTWYITADTPNATDNAIVGLSAEAGSDLSSVILYAGVSHSIQVTSDLIQINGPLYVPSSEIRQGYTDYGAYEIQTSGRIYANDYGVFLGGLHVGGSSDPGTDNLIVDGEIRQGSTDYGAYEIQTGGQLYVDDYGVFMGGVHIGGTSDPGTDNLVVDGTTTLTGTLYATNFNYDRAMSTVAILGTSPHRITHNFNTTTNRIFCINGDYSANGFTVVGVKYVNTNSFDVYFTGGSSGANARFNYLIID